MNFVKPPLSLTILLAISAMILQGCYCAMAGTLPFLVCQSEDGSTYILEIYDLPDFDECAYMGDTHVANTSEYPPTAVPDNSFGSGNGTNNIVGHSGVGLNCDPLALTSPTGLPNGITTFYWNSAQGAVAYRINIYDHNGVYLATFDSQGEATNLTADVSWGAIGGQYELLIEIVAFGGGTSCSRTVTLQREVPSGNIPSNNIPSGSSNNGGGNEDPDPTPEPPR